MNVKDPLRYIMQICLQLAAAETYTSALDWFRQPLVSLAEWSAAVVEVQKKRPKAR